MVKRLIWQLAARRSLREIVAYLETNFSRQTAENFIDNVDRLIDQLIQYPESGRKVRFFRTIRTRRIDANRKIYYRFKGSQIRIVDIIDTRTDPAKNRYE